VIEISKLKKGSRVIRHWKEGETKISEFIVTSTVNDPNAGWICHLDWADDDYCKKIFEKDQKDYEYGRRRNDRTPRNYKEG